MRDAAKPEPAENLAVEEPWAQDFRTEKQETHIANAAGKDK